MEIELQAYSDEQDKWSKRLATRLKAGFAGLPKLARGCYEKQGYSLEIILQGDVYAYKASGATRMRYANLRNPNVVANVMPAKSSKLWQPGWTQNVTEAYVEAFVSALWAIAKMANLDLVAPDPHPHPQGVMSDVALKALNEELDGIAMVYCTECISHMWDSHRS